MTTEDHNKKKKEEEDEAKRNVVIPLFVEMGFEATEAAEAIQLCNGDCRAALDLLITKNNPNGDSDSACTSSGSKALHEEGNSHGGYSHGGAFSSIAPGDLFSPVVVQESSAEKWVRLSDRMLVQCDGMMTRLIRYGFKMLRISMIKICLTVGKPEGSWPIVTAKIMELRSIRDLVASMIYVWSQCSPSDFDEEWTEKLQRKWLKYSHILLHRISLTDISLDVAMSDAYELVRKFGHSLKDKSRIRSLRTINLVLRVSSEASQKISACTYEFPKTRLADVPRDLNQEDAKEDGEELDLSKAAMETAQYVATAAVTSFSASALFMLMRKMAPKDASGDAAIGTAMAVGVATGTAATAGQAAVPVIAAGMVAAHTVLLPPAAFAAATAVAFVGVGELIPLVGLGLGGALGYGAVKAWTNAQGPEGLKEGAAEAAHAFFEERRVIWQQGHLDSATRLLGWNNLAWGDEEDIIEILVSPCLELERGEVMFELTALPHIVWDKQVELMFEDESKNETLQVNKEVTASLSRVLNMKKHWPVKLQFKKSYMPGMFKDIGDPWEVPKYLDLGMSLVRIIFVKVRPNDY